MTIFYYEHELQKCFRDLEARDRQLTRWGWFRRNQGRPRKIGWRFRIGDTLIRLGSWLQERGGPQPAQTSEGSSEGF